MDFASNSLFKEFREKPSGLTEAVGKKDRRWMRIGDNETAAAHLWPSVMNCPPVIKRKCTDSKTKEKLSYLPYYRLTRRKKAQAQLCKSFILQDLITCFSEKLSQFGFVL